MRRINVVLKRYFIILLSTMLTVFVFPVSVSAAETSVAFYQPELFSDFHSEDLTLFAKGAVLIHCDNNRILYGKNANTPMPNASTTKILTCILAIESGKLQDVVTVSEYACKMPQVKLGFSAGDTFYLKDLLYSLMLESHNDSAVAIAEHIAGSVEKFAEQMNEKARELGCRNSHFVTPNGLDDADEGGVHSTSAYDLSCIMSYCLQNDNFLEITRTQSKQISNEKGTKTYSLNNHNALLTMMDGALTGKTGFTGDAGYCYVGAYEKDGKTFAFALLACGWPNNKSYKWSDSKKLIAYGEKNYARKEISKNEKTFTIGLRQGVLATRGIAYPTKVQAKVEGFSQEMLLADTDKIAVTYDLEKALTAPVSAGDVVGQEKIYLNQCLIGTEDIRLTESVERFDLLWCIRCVGKKIIEMSISKS